VLFELGLALLVEDEENAAVCCHDGGVDIDAVLQLEHGLLGHFLVLCEIVHFHLVVLFHLELVFSLFADGRLEHEAGHGFSHLYHFLYDLVGEAVNGGLLLAAPHQHPSFLQIYAHDTSTRCHVQIFHRVLVGVSVIDRH